MKDVILPVFVGSPAAIYIRAQEDIAWFWSQVAQAALYDIATSWCEEDLREIQARLYWPD